MSLTFDKYHLQNNPKSAFLGPIDVKKEAKAAEEAGKLERKRKRVMEEEKRKEREVLRLREEEDGRRRSQAYLEDRLEDNKDNDDNDDVDDEEDEDEDDDEYDGDEDDDKTMDTSPHMEEGADVSDMDEL